VSADPAPAPSGVVTFLFTDIEAQFSASPDLQNEFVGAVIGAMASSEDLSTQILNNPELSQTPLGELVPIIYQGLKTAG
jgi:hypothetical protein